MKRRDIIKGGIGLLAFGAAGSALSARPCPPALSGSEPSACPGPLGTAKWTWDAPSLQDERDFYDNILGWVRTLGDENLNNLSSTPSGGFSNIHKDSEADDLWTWDQQNKRYQTADTQGWRDAWLDWQKNNLINELNANDGDGAPSGYGYDHMYGQGLAVVYHDTNDASILPVFDSLKTIIQGRSLYQDIVAGKPVAMSRFESRGPARWTIVAAYIAQATNDAGWIVIRDNLLDGWMNSTDWEEGGVISAGGNYFASRAQAGYVNGGAAGEAAYDLGRRFQSSFEGALHVEALWRGYIATGRSDLRARLIKLAQYVRYYGHRPTWIHPNVGGRFGHQGDGRWYISDGDGTQNNAAKDCSYDLSLVNSQVIGYKLTGDSAYLDFARTLFQRGIAFDQGSPWPRYAPEGEVWQFIDTFGIGSSNYFAFNKGALQYVYLLLENGGNPSRLL